jgi:hypothetical protein
MLLCHLGGYQNPQTYCIFVDIPKEITFVKPTAPNELENERQIKRQKKFQ